eukprot:CAMPEP_0184370178 /NCGR_PEP_ID=MMETSP1089-20130417/162676_1 /TAXON_ID=38269 ORGANISM="Gloeochaete wittrockiana, Strain SAG46.84" /NCGR_SAMPLE_ID=MMETSP1089 /ASSEMBLY_ACC=CAM_ASM_000445 /LENGTH=250 /DNA_ID=CAMNT_0026712743 /DNA_START=54 /DNA_END=805 /DNA_ORIENTATION=-
MDVTQAIYCFLRRIPFLETYLSRLDILALLIAALCHDLDHPGTTAAFQIATLSRLAQTYNDVAVLENHHSAKAWSILNEKDSVIGQLAVSDRLTFRKIFTSCILATDMFSHPRYMKKFRKRLSHSIVRPFGIPLVVPNSNSNPNSKSSASVSPTASSAPSESPSSSPNSNSNPNSNSSPNSNSNRVTPDASASSSSKPSLLSRLTNRPSQGRIASSSSSSRITSAFTVFHILDGSRRTKEQMEEHVKEAP